MARAVRTTKGFVLTELIVALSLLGLIFAGLALSTHGFGAFNRYQWARQQCIAAAQAQLDSLTARGTLIDAEACKRLWPDVDMTVKRRLGDRQWKGLGLVQITATSQAGPRQVRVELARYVQTSPEGQGEGQSL